MHANKLFVYQETRLLTAPPSTLARVALEEAVKAANGAIRALKSGDAALRSRAITKSMNLLTEFMAMLNDEAAPDLCLNLKRTCDYAHRRLLSAHVSQSEPMLREVISLIQPIAEAWATVERRMALVAS